MQKTSLNDLEDFIKWLGNCCIILASLYYCNCTVPWKKIQIRMGRVLLSKVAEKIMIIEDSKRQFLILCLDLQALKILLLCQRWLPHWKAALLETLMYKIKFVETSAHYLSITHCCTYVLYLLMTSVLLPFGELKMTLLCSSYSLSFSHRLHWSSLWSAPLQSSLTDLHFSKITEMKLFIVL